MYMNCAPVTVTPSNQRRRRGIVERRTDGMDSLPDMFRANSGNGCSTAESGRILAIPAENLGQYVQRIGTDPLTPPVGNCGADQVEGAISSSPSALATTTVSTMIAASAPSVVPAASQPTVASAVAPAQQATSAPASSSPSPAAISSTPGTKIGTCFTPGRSVCAPDLTSWGNCMENNQVIYQPVAVGTKCDPALGVEVAA